LHHFRIDDDPEPNFHKMERRTEMITKIERPPMILPWLARKAGIPIEVAENYWREASKDAARRHGVGSSSHCKDAIDRVLEMINTEALARSSMTFGCSLWLRLPVRLWLYGINFSEAWALAAVRRIAPGHCRNGMEASV
jgi:hypothetical protein